MQGARALLVVPPLLKYSAGQNRVSAADELNWVRGQLESRPGLRAIVEHNDFQLERLSPMARSPEANGIEVTGQWPWASVLGWQVAPSRAMRLPLAG